MAKTPHVFPIVGGRKVEVRPLFLLSLLLPDNP